MKIKFYFTLVFTSIFLSVNAQKINSVKIDSLFAEFKKNSFYGNVSPAKKELENYQKDIIPELIKLLKDTTFSKLTGTADLIYPGTTTFYGRGEYLPYNIDWISIRSGWLLEDLTFQDFGYKNIDVTDETLMKLSEENYNDYIKKGSYELDWKNKTIEERTAQYRKNISLNAKKWWKENGKKWNRISAIKEALESNNENRLSNVFQYLRFGESKSDNLTVEIFNNEIKPIIVSLKKTSKFPEIQEQIESILVETVNSKILDLSRVQ
ncbi:hypothetical protein C8C83_4614 [Flavobacterium sp. 90]|uniref:hypothetical protein n=1 Tax=unclassified Flavobacterium TaxID=196869 RepID=UPI000EB4FE49|nr:MULTISPECIES: hypothetical protein [unclassified Flavobacterium]RKR05273.1 hypothetical protein C8C82_4956 [Flavobacterium sp. 81]TCK56588.1 hypothetical protein C8C83_4614 [Flavobacterium sp. 90]